MVFPPVLFDAGGAPTQGFDVQVYQFGLGTGEHVHQHLLDGLAYVETYGCQQNEADSERIRGLLTACGYEFGMSGFGRCGGGKGRCGILPACVRLFAGPAGLLGG